MSKYLLLGILFICIGLVYATDISDCTGLQNINTNLSGNYVLVNDIDCSETITWNGGSGFIPLGNSSGSRFSGTFDGQYHIITDLHINRPSSNGVGLFGMTYNAVIKNVGILRADVSGASACGVLAGIINNTYISASFTGGIIHCYSLTGGVVGYLASGNISDSYNSANVSSVSAPSGGMIGYNTGAVSNSYSIGNAQSASGGLIGTNNGIVMNSFWDIDASGQMTSDGGTGKSTAQMMDISTFSDADWDIALIGSYIDETWGINNSNDYPRLGWQMPLSSLKVELVSPVDNANVFNFSVNFLSNITSGSRLINAILLTNETGTWNARETRWIGEVPYTDAGLLALLHFNYETVFGESNNFIHDFSGNNNNATCYGEACPEHTLNGVFGNYRYFDGESTPNYDYLTLSSTLKDPELEGYTIGMWFNVSHNPSGDTNRTVLFQWYLSQSSANPMITVEINASRYVLATFRDSNNVGATAKSFSPVNLNTWYYLVATRVNRTTIKLYLNGVNVANATNNNLGNISGTSTFGPKIGISYTYNSGGSPWHYWFKGGIDEFAIWKRPLSDGEIATLYDYSKNRFYPQFQKRTLPIGTYRWNVLATDILQGIFASNDYAFSVRSPPIVNIIYPENTYYYSGVSHLDYAVSGINLDKCWYSINNGPNSDSVPAGVNFTGMSSSLGWNNWTVWCNNTASVEGSDSVSFYVSDSLNNWYVRPKGLINGDGSSYANAWSGFNNIDWSVIGPDDRLYVCGKNYETLIVGNSGYPGHSIIITGNCPGDKGSIDGRSTVNNANWIAVNPGVYKTLMPTDVDYVQATAPVSPSIGKKWFATTHLDDSRMSGRARTWNGTSWIEDSYWFLSPSRVFIDGREVNPVRTPSNGSLSFTGWTKTSFSSINISGKPNNYWTGCIFSGQTLNWQQEQKIVTSSSGSTIYFDPTVYTPDGGNGGRLNQYLEGCINEISHLYEWGYNSTYLYIYLDSTTSHTISFTNISYGLFGKNKDYITVEYLNISYTNDAAIMNLYGNGWNIMNNNIQGVSPRSGSFIGGAIWIEGYDIWKDSNLGASTWSGEMPPMHVVNITIKNNIIRDTFGGNGIDLYGVIGGKIDNNTILDTGYTEQRMRNKPSGIQIILGSMDSVSGNRIKNAGYAGIFGTAGLNPGRRWNISNNIIINYMLMFGDGGGIQFGGDGSDNMTWQFNRIENTGGQRLLHGYYLDNYAERNFLNANYGYNVQATQNSAFTRFNGGYNNLSNSLVYDADIPLYVSGATGNTFVNNNRYTQSMYWLTYSDPVRWNAWEMDTPWTYMNSTIINGIQNICVYTSSPTNCTLNFNGTIYTNLSQSYTHCFSINIPVGIYNNIYATCKDGVNTRNSSAIWLKVKNKFIRNNDLTRTEAP